MPRRPSFAVVVPAHNEQAGIAACVEAIDTALGTLPNETALIVVDDGSIDETGERLAGLVAAHPRLVVERHPQNRGYGAALRTGARLAIERGFDYTLFMDSDLTNDPRYLPAFAARMEDGADVIKATRYAGGGGVEAVPWWRVVPSVVGNRLARILHGLPLSDSTNGFRAVRTELLGAVELRENRFPVIMEELHRLRPVARTYAEVPNVLTNRGEHLSGSSFSYGPRALWGYLKYPLQTAFDRLRGR